MVKCRRGRLLSHQSLSQSRQKGSLVSRLKVLVRHAELGVGHVRLSGHITLHFLGPVCVKRLLLVLLILEYWHGLDLLH